MKLFQYGDFTLNSGKKSKFKIDCDGLGWDDLSTLAAVASKIVQPFSEVYGIPRGGLRLANALQPFKTPSADNILIVDDVLTTGGSMERMLKEFQKARPRKDIGPSGEPLPHRGATGYQGLVIFARSTPPSWIVPIFQMNSDIDTYVESV